MRMKILLATLIPLLCPMVSNAQLAGFNASGDMGLMAGTQGPPGFYAIAGFLDYSSDTARNKNGDEVPEVFRADINAKAGVFGLVWVSEKKILGGNYSASIWPSVTNNALEFPILARGYNVSAGLGDLYIQPMSIGWHTKRADFIAGVGLYAPTGEWDIDGEENRGLGMWGFELYGATTLYLDRAKTWNFAAFAAYETHSKKEGTDVRVGDILTLEGGLGKSFKQGMINVGLTYYAQWKVTHDDFGLDIDLPDGPLIGKHQVYGYGPEVSIPLASKKKLYGFLNLRYMWETGARTMLEGNAFMVTLSFPIPSVSLQ